MKAEAHVWLPIESAPQEFDRPDRVLLLGDMGICFGKIFKWPDGEVVCSCDGYNGEWNVTHWMPLPPPPNNPASVRERGEMSIVLKTDPKELVYAPVTATDHDALAAHAMQMAEEDFAREYAPTCWRVHAVDWINERAAANLARLMGDGK